MHELGVTQQILEVILKKAKEAEAEKVTRINLVIGEMTGIVDDSVQFYFDLLSKDSIAGGAILSFERVSTLMRCRRCGFSFTLDKSLWSCPQCKEWDAEVVAGREFYIDSIEVE